MSDECWMVWYRGYWELDGRWIAHIRTPRRLRRDAIAAFISYGMVNGERGWMKARRRGIVKCVRTRLEADDE